MDIITSLFLNYVFLFLVVAASSVVLYFGVRWVIKNIKLIACCTLAVGLVLAAIVLVPQLAHAEKLPEDFYYKVVFIDEPEEVELDRYDIEHNVVAKFLVHTDDLDHLWNYWDTTDEDEEDFVDYEFDRELSNIALYWIRENDIDIELDKEERITRGRIVVLTMWECDPDDPFDEEVVDVYYTEFVTE